MDRPEQPGTERERQPDRAHDEGRRLGLVELLAELIAREHVPVHVHGAPPGSRVRSAAGNSAAGACWLS